MKTRWRVKKEYLSKSRAALVVPFDEGFDPCLKQALGELLDGLPTKQQHVIFQRFWNRRTLKEVGRQLGLTTERIRQIQFQALRQLRVKLVRSELV